MRRQWLAPPERRQPPGTVAQIVVYFDQGVPVAEVHQYVLPTGAIGASGLPDPVRVVLNNRVYMQKRKRR